MTRDEEIVLFHYVLGVAITQWSNVEHLLRTVVVTAFANEKLNWESLSVGYFSLDTFRPKLQFADGVISRKLAPHPALHAEWKKLSVKARDLSTHRNKLAHWGMGRYWKRRPGLRVVLEPWVFQKRKKKTRVPQPPIGSLNIVEIYKFSMAFTAFACSLSNFHHRLCNKPEPHAKSEEQPGRPPTAETLMHQIREVVANRPEPSEAKS